MCKVLKVCSKTDDVAVDCCIAAALESAVVKVTCAEWLPVLGKTLTEGWLWLS